VYFYSATISNNQSFHNSKPKSNAFTIVRYSVLESTIGFEQLVQVFFLDADSCVFNSDMEKFLDPVVPELNEDFTLVCKFDGVLDKVNHDLLQSKVISFHYF
jgi:hypothetical protein